MNMTKKGGMGITFFVPMVFVLLWSTGFIAAKFTIAYAPPFKLLFLRGLLSCLVFLVMVLIARVKFPPVKSIIEQMKAGLLMHTLFLGGCFYAINQGMSPALVALITGLQPILPAIILSFSDQASMSRMKWLGVVVGFVGVCLVLSPSKTSNHVELIPLISAVLALVGVTTGALYQKKVNSTGHILSLTFFQYVSLTLVMGILSYFFESDTVVAWSLSFIAGLVWLVVGVSVSAILLLIYLLKIGEATKVTTYFYLVPVATALEAWLFFAEPITMGTAVGMLTTIIGMVLVII
ncbi:DMT family transporter [Acinetobacter sp. 216872]|uniref:DMT family transporter n=1 Tax=Acinetobacter sp. 216872 TaxID=1310734 RepID=UPI0004528A1B|nr:DMT family transporter [Acinetobacter sp. 216872]EXH74124.1 eamA-like transporter family protein [Acinetobacter sp. 216872]